MFVAVVIILINTPIVKAPGLYKVTNLAGVALVQFGKDREDSLPSLGAIELYVTLGRQRDG